MKKIQIADGGFNWYIFKKCIIFHVSLLLSLSLSLLA